MRNHKTVLMIAVIALLIVMFAGYSWYQRQHQPVTTLYGNVDIRTLNISFRVSGRLTSLNVDEGDTIAANQLLGQLDPAPYQIALHQASANVAIAQADYDLAKAGYRNEEIAQVSAAVKQAQAAYDYAENFYRRQQILFKRHLISTNELDSTRSVREQAKASLKSLEDKLAQYRRGNRPQQIESAYASLQLAEAQLEKAKLDLQDTRLHAPADGIILTRAIEPGSMVNAGGNVLTLSLANPVWARAYASEKELGDMYSGRTVLLYTDSRPNNPYHGQIGFVSPTAEFTPKTVETTDLRSDLVYRLRIIVTDADKALRQGMPVTIVLDNHVENITGSHGASYGD